MKKFLKFFPFLFVFLLAFGLQTQMDVTERYKPFPEPFGREQLLGDMTPNRPAQALGDNRFAWLLEKNMVVTTIDPAGQQVATENRPLPHEDIYANTNFKMIGDDVVWIGGNRTLKMAKWQVNAWSQPQAVSDQVRAMDFKAAGDTKVLVAGAGKELKVWELTLNGLTNIGSLPFKKIAYSNAAVDRQGIVHIEVLDETGSGLYELFYLTVNPKSKKISKPIAQYEITLDTNSMIDDSVFGIDNTHGYVVTTMMSTKTHVNDLRLYSFPLNQPTAGTFKKLAPKLTEGNATAEFAYGAYLEPGQGDSLRMIYAAQFGVSPRANGYEVFLSTFQNGDLKPDGKRVSTSRKMAMNPVFSKHGDATIVLYTLFNNYDRYTIYSTSDDPKYAAATNKLTLDDYTYSAMQVPQYMGVAAVLMFYGLAWPVASFIYLGFFIAKREDSLYDHADRHLLVAVVLYLVSQISIFLLYAKLDNFYTYSPEWMHSNTVIALLMVGFGIVTYLFTKLFGKLIYERNATFEFGYFTGLNLWSVLLFLSYFMAR